MSDQQHADKNLGNELQTNPVAEEAIGSGQISPPRPDDAQAPPSSRSGAAELERSWRITAAIALVIAVAAAGADRLHPAIGATFEAREPSPGTVVVLRDANLKRPVTTRTSAFGLSQILPPGPIEVPGRGGELLLRLRIAAGDCRRLVARVGGSCAGRPQPVPMPEQLGITALKGSLEARLGMTTADQAHFGWHHEALHPRPRDEWSLTENARETTLTLRCLQPVPLAVTLLPAHAHPNCAPDGPFFKLSLANRKPYAPILSLAGTRNFRAVAAASSAEMTVDAGTLSFGDVQRKPLGVEPTPVSLEGAEPVEMRLSPATKGTAVAKLVSAKTSRALLGDEDTVPSLLERNSTVEALVFGLLATSLIGAFTFYIRALIANLSKER